MTLEELANGATAVPLSLIGADPVLVRQLQTRLGEIGLLDPPVDGQFGPVSQWALAALLQRLKRGTTVVIDRATARALLDATVRLFPIKRRKTLADRLVQTLHARGHWIQRHPDCVNILYVEGMDADGTPNANVPNQFNDLRLVLRISPSGVPEILESWEATSEPGLYYTAIEPLDPHGAARIAFGQYKSWVVGTHMAGKKNAHEALVQNAPIKVYRDLNQDFQRTGDAIYEGLFGVNQHCGYDMKQSDVGRASAGCLVGRTRGGHTAFMRYCKADPRYTANNGYRFMTAVFPAAEVPA